MRKILIVALLLVVCAIALTSILRQVRKPAAITPIEMERLTGAGLALGLGDGDSAGMLVVADETRPGIPDYSIRMEGLKAEAVQRGFAESAIALEKWPVDPMHRQAGQADFRLENLFNLLARYPGVKHVVLMLDLAAPSAAERETARTRGLVIMLLTNNEVLGRQLHQEGVVRTVFLSRTSATHEPPPSAYADKKFEVLHRRFAILTAP